MKSLSALAPFALALPLVAQNVSPAHFARAPGNTYESAPLGDTRVPYRYLQVHDDMSGRAQTIRGLSLRRDDSLTSAYAAFNVIVDVFLSNAATTAATASTTFDSNHGTNRTQCCSFAVVNLPATTHGLMPDPFVYRVPLTTPFVWNGQGSLCWEIRVQSRTNSGTSYFDAASGSSTNPQPATNNFGRGCRATGYVSSQYMTMNGSAQPNWSGGSVNLTYTGSFMPQNGVVLLMAGTSSTSFFGVPLPFLLPGTDAPNVPSGPCNLYNSMALLIPALTTANGTMNAFLAVPGTPEFNGASVFAQVLAPDAQANAVGIVTSNSVQHTLVAPYTSVPVSKVDLASSLAATGTRTLNNGLIVLFD